MNAKDLFPQLESLDVLQLDERYNELRDIPRHEPQSDGLPCTCGRCQTDEHLMEMISILGILRRKSAGPPKPKRIATPATAPSLDQL